MSTHLVEMFSSIQGEGLYIGVRQIFIRLSGCNLTCDYCDTPYDSTPCFRVEIPSGSGQFRSYENPVSPSIVAGICRELGMNNCHSVSLTGGEPLLHCGFIRELSQILRETGIKFYLETNGTLPDKLASIIDCIDIISMDVKLPTSSGCGELWSKHQDFMEIGRQKDIFVKVVITRDTTEEEIINTCDIIRKVDLNIPLVIQPVESHQGFPGKNPSIEKIMRFQEIGLDFIDDVRVIPQTHKYIGLL